MTPPPRPDLESILRARIGKEGRIPFRDFMEAALYHPTLGYYMTDREKIGREGDFFTSPDVHRVFGVCLMKQLAELRTLLAPSGPFPVIEAGGGKGSLARQILDAARERAPGLYEAIRYILVEKSPTLRQVQEETLSAAGHADKTDWAASVAEALEGTDGAVVLSNELIDAFPVHRIVFTEGEWREIHVDAGEEGLFETTGPLSSAGLGKLLSRIGSDFEEGYETEVNLDGSAWIETVGRSMKRGVVITIDYGYPRADYYAPVRRKGTLLCYFRHTVSDKPLERAGEQDMTAHVDFTALAEAGRKAGLEITGYCDQFHLLMGLGVFDELSAHDSDFNAEAYGENLAVKRLLMPEGMGGTFRVLIQHKGIERPALRAFSFKDLSHRL